MVRKKKEVSRRESLLSELASECESPEEFMDLLSDLKKSLLEKALDAEMDHHLGYRKHEAAGRGTGNSRNGKSKKTVQGEFGQTEIETPRDRNGSFEPKLIGKHKRRFYNEMGQYYSSEYRFDKADVSHDAAIKISSSLPTQTPETNLELARAHVLLGDLTPQRRQLASAIDRERETPEHSRAHLQTALSILSGMEQTSQTESIRLRKNSDVLDILRARCQLGLSRLTTDKKAKSEFKRAAVSILKKKLKASPDSTAIRFELIRALSDQNVRRANSPPEIERSAQMLNEALDKIRPLREVHPNNPAIAVQEVHVRHKFSVILRRQARLSEADEQISTAIDVQSSLVDLYPQSVSHRCWRALLYRSLAEIKLELTDLPSAKAIIKKGEEDLQKIDGEFDQHPFVIRVRNAIQDYHSK
jgi:hypothetical protein